MEILIEKVKLIKGEKLDVVVKRKQADNTYISSAESYDRRVHPDLTGKLARLVPHLAVLTGYILVKQVKKDIHAESHADLFEDFKVSSYSIGGKEGSEGITITGHYLSPTGGAVILNTPFKRLETEDENQYVFMDDLQGILNELEEEVKAYMDGTKVGVDPQGTLDFPVPESELMDADFEEDPDAEGD